MSEAEEARVIAHELGHAILHDKLDERFGEEAESRNVKEVEAESVAFAIMSDYGIETDYSASYIRNWSADKKENTKELKASSARIRLAAAEFFTHRDEVAAAAHVEAETVAATTT